jgi:hypothetical protein
MNTYDYSIHHATEQRCIAEQRAHRDVSASARDYLEHGHLGRAAQEQRDSAYHHAQMWMRLARLIGVE